MSLGCNGGGSGAFVVKNNDATSWHENFATKAPDPPHWTLNSCFGAFRTTGCVRCEKFRHDVMARTFALVWPILHRVLYGNQTVQNTPKLQETQQNMSLGSNGVDRVRSLFKIPTRLRGTNICTSSACFALSFVRQPNGPKCTQIVGNTTKHEFRVQWDGLGAFVAKNSDATSWHKLLH